MGLKGSKSMLTFFSLPSSVTMVPQYTTRPLGGTAKSKGKQYYTECTKGLIRKNTESFAQYILKAFINCNEIKLQKHCIDGQTNFAII